MTIKGLKKLAGETQRKLDRNGYGLTCAMNYKISANEVWDNFEADPYTRDMVKDPDIIVFGKVRTPQTMNQIRTMLERAIGMGA